MSESAAEIYSLLIPLAEARLLVPRACVAEIAGCGSPRFPTEDEAMWADSGAEQRANGNCRPLGHSHRTD